MKKNKPIKVCEHFGKLSYRGKKINFNQPMEMKVLTYQHINLVSGFSSDAKRTHACLRFGNWCWKDALEHPLDILIYLRLRKKVI